MRQFYLRSICQAYKMQSFKELYSFLLSLLVVALSEDVGHIDNNPTPAEKCLQSVNDYIKGECLEEYDVKSEILADDILHLDSSEIPISWQKWSDDIYNKANDLASKWGNGNIVNAFYNSEAAKKIKNLIQDLPLWTNVMRPYFKCGTDIATSSSVESIFAEYKTRVFKGNIPMRVDKFIISHLDYLDGRLRLDCAANISSLQQECKIQTEDNQIDEHISDLSNNISLLNSTPISNDNKNAHHSNMHNFNLTTDSNVCDSNVTNISSMSSINLSHSINDNDDIIDSLNFEENWMGLTKRNVKKFSNAKKDTYLDKFPE